MNVTVETLAACKKLVRVEVDAATVDAAFEKSTREVMKVARIPGFRPGKAPRHLVIKAFSGHIDEEVRRTLLSESWRKAIAEQKLEVVSKPEVEEIQFGRGQAYQFAATIETAPDFELPEYKGLPVKKEMRSVTEEDLAQALDRLREQRATYLSLEGPVKADDYVVVNYEGTCDGQPITELAPTAQGLTHKKDFWIHVAPGSFIPGFTDQLLGASKGEHRTVTVDFPADFVTPQLAGRRGVYEVDVVDVKQKIMAPLDDAFAKNFGAESVEALREGVRRDLENELNYTLKRTVRDQLVKGLLARVTCDLPESAVLRETKNVVYDILRENQERGISRDVIDRQKDQIFSFANNSARDRVKAGFIFGKIAEREGFRAEEQEVGQRILMLASQYNIKPEQMVKQLRERDGISEIAEQIVTNKVLDFLEAQAQVEEVLPAGGTPA